MKLLLSGDEYCYKYAGNYYLSDTGAIQVDRYLRSFDSVKLAFRTKEVFDKEQLGKHVNQIKDNRISVIEVPFFQGPKQFPIRALSIKSVLNKSIADCDYAIMRIPSVTSFMVYQAVKRKNIPFASEVVFDCVDAIDASTSFMEKLIWKVMHKIQFDICQNSKGVSCVTKYYLQKHYYPKNKNAITTHYSSIELKPDFFYQARNYPDKDILTIIHVANQIHFNGRKGHNQLVEVLAKINKDEKKARVLFVGEDYLDGMNQLKKFAESLEVSDDISFTGFLRHNDLRKMLISSDIAILPTKAEGLPRVVIEAMALGLPCITSPVSGNPELVSDEMLVGYDDIDGMASVCKRLIDDKNFYIEQSKRNFENSQEYSTEVLNPRRTKFYNSIQKVK